MNWKLIFQLSAFGLIMAFATVSLIPEKMEPAFWLVIFIFCAWVIARVCTGKYFLHGFLVSMVNCIWITAVHLFFYISYTINHLDMTGIYTAMPLSLNVHPHLSMAIAGPFFGAMFGIILGLFSFIASKIVTKTAIA
jgi:hypothetical protein